MAERHLFLAIPADLHEEAITIARSRGMFVTDLLIEALSKHLESLEEPSFPAKKTSTMSERVYFPKDNHASSRPGRPDR